MSLTISAPVSSPILHLMKRDTDGNEQTFWLDIKDGKVICGGTIEPDAMAAIFFDGLRERINALLGSK